MLIYSSLKKVSLFMERLAELIGKLKEQFEQKADPSKLLGLTRLIEQELMKYDSSGKQVRSSSKVSVVMPAARNGFHSRAEEIVAKETPAAFSLIEDPAIEAPVTKQNNAELQYDPMRDAPTLAHQKNSREINETIGSLDSSLNDKLKEEKVEVGHLLTDSPIRDLKRAIGINDRYVFINELFRGDEVMYERSIKTINSFRIFAEAEYWIERELKVKLGWEEHKETTRHFYQLVKRRFS